MYQNAAVFFKKHNSISETQFNLKNTIQFHDNNIHFISYSLITKFNFQKHFSIFKAQFSFKNTKEFHDHNVHSISTENTIQFSKTQIHMKTHLKIYRACAFAQENCPRLTFNLTVYLVVPLCFLLLQGTIIVIIANDVMLCSRCSRTHGEGYNFCIKCGLAQRQANLGRITQTVAAMSPTATSSQSQRNYLFLPNLFKKSIQLN